MTPQGDGETARRRVEEEAGWWAAAGRDEGRPRAYRGRRDDAEAASWRAAAS